MGRTAFGGPEAAPGPAEEAADHKRIDAHGGVGAEDDVVAGEGEVTVVLPGRRSNPKELLSVRKARKREVNKTPATHVEGEMAVRRTGLAGVRVQDGDFGHGVPPDDGSVITHLQSKAP